MYVVGLGSWPIMPKNSRDTDSISHIPTYLLCFPSFARAGVHGNSYMLHALWWVHSIAWLGHGINFTHFLLAIFFLLWARTSLPIQGQEPNALFKGEGKEDEDPLEFILENYNTLAYDTWPRTLSLIGPPRLGHTIYDISCHMHNSVTYHILRRTLGYTNDQQLCH